MDHRRDLSVADLSSQTVGFWSSGNAPTQAVYGLTHAEISATLKALCLLTDRVVAAGSFFFESPLTRDVATDLEAIFASEDAAFFIEEAIDSFEHHGIMKSGKSPLAMYQEPVSVREAGAALDRLSLVLRRPDRSISDLIVKLWISGVESHTTGTLGHFLKNALRDPGRYLAARTSLIEIAERRTTEFVWEYLGPALQSLHLPEYVITSCRRRLTQMYSLATAQLLGANIDLPEHSLREPFIGSYSRCDTALFLSCLEIMGLRQALAALTGPQLLQVKYSTRFRVFHTFYVDLLDLISGDVRLLRKALPLYADAAARPAVDRRSGLLRWVFLRRFEKLCAKLLGGRRRYSKPLKAFLEACSVFAIEPVDAFTGFFGAITGGLTMVGSKRSVDVAILTVKPIELAAIRREIGSTGDGKTGDYVARAFYEGCIRGKDGRSYSAVCTRAMEQGNKSMMAAFQAFTLEYAPRLVVLLGIGGGIHRKLKLCDVVLADMIIDYEKAAITDAGDEHRPRVYEMPARVKEMVARFEDLYESEEPELGAADGSFQTTFRVYLAPVGTGEKVLKKELHPIRDWLATVHANAMLVETEAAGACQQFYESQLLKDFRAAGLLIIRGISDHADFEKDDKWQLLCCLNAMRCLRAILCANPDFASER